MAETIPEKEYTKQNYKEEINVEGQGKYVKV